MLVSKKPCIPNETTGRPKATPGIMIRIGHVDLMLFFSYFHLHWAVNPGGQPGFLVKYRLKGLITLCIVSLTFFILPHVFPFSSRFFLAF